MPHTCTCSPTAGQQFTAAISTPAGKPGRKVAKSQLFIWPNCSCSSHLLFVTSDLQLGSQQPCDLRRGRRPSFVGCVGLFELRRSPNCIFLHSRWPCAELWECDNWLMMASIGRIPKTNTDSNSQEQLRKVFGPKCCDGKCLPSTMRFSQLGQIKNCLFSFPIWVFVIEQKFPRERKVAPAENPKRSKFELWQCCNSTFFPSNWRLTVSAIFMESHKIQQYSSKCKRALKGKVQQLLKEKCMESCKQK